MCAVFFFTWLPTIWKNGMFQINILGEGWYDLLDPDLTWIVAVGGSSPWIWLMLGFLQRLRSSRRITFDFSSLILQLAVCYLVFQPRAGSVGLSKREWEDLLGQREPESSGFAGRFSPLVPDSPPPPGLPVRDPRGCSDTYLKMPSTCGLVEGTWILINVEVLTWLSLDFSSAPYCVSDLGAVCSTSLNLSFL